MKRLHANISARNAALEQAPEVFQPVRVDAAANVFHGMIHDFVSVLRCQSLIRKQEIAVQCRASLHVLFHFCLNGFLFAVRDDGSTHFAVSAFAAVSALQNANDGGFIARTAASDAALFHINVHVPRFAADESFVRFALATEFAAEEIILHCKANPMQHEPSRLLGNPNVTSNLITADSIFAIGDQPSCREPFVQTDSGVFHDSSNLNGEFSFCMMLSASPSASFWIKLCIIQSATWAYGDPIFPAPDSKVINAVIRIREVNNGFLQAFRFGHGFDLHEQNYSLKRQSSQVYYYHSLSTAKVTYPAPEWLKRRIEAVSRLRTSK